MNLQKKYSYEIKREVSQIDAKYVSIDEFTSLINDDLLEVNDFLSNLDSSIDQEKFVRYFNVLMKNFVEDFGVFSNYEKLPLCEKQYYIDALSYKYHPLNQLTIAKRISIERNEVLNSTLNLFQTILRIYMSKDNDLRENELKPLLTNISTLPFILGLN